MDYAIETRGLYKWFDGLRPLTGLISRFQPVLFWVIGPNRAGKTTLMQMTGIIHPDKGEPLMGRSIRETAAYATGRLCT